MIHSYDTYHYESDNKNQTATRHLLQEDFFVAWNERQIYESIEISMDCEYSSRDG